jgi:hypothetical protein
LARSPIRRTNRDGEKVGTDGIVFGVDERKLFLEGGGRGFRERFLTQIGQESKNPCRKSMFFRKFFESSKKSRMGLSFSKEIKE